MKLNIIGPLVPPFGGVSVHISRLRPVLKFNDINYAVHDFNKKLIECDSKNIRTKSRINLLINILSRKYGSNYHVHISSLKQLLFAMILLIFGFQIIITFHNEKFYRTNILKRTLTICILHSFQSRLSIISVSQAYNKYLNSKNIECIYLPAYIKPDKNELNTKNSLIKSQITQNQGNICFNIWRYTNEVADKIYGLDLLEKYFSNHKRLLVKYCLNFFVGDSSSDLEHLKQRLDKNFKGRYNLIVSEPLVPYLDMMDVLIRTNRVDAYGVSIIEALDINVNVIASNVCLRPSGCVLFNPFDFADYEFAMNKFFYEGILYNIKKKFNTDYGNDLIRIYKKKFK